MKNIRSLIAVAVLAATGTAAFAQETLGASTMAMTPTYNANWMSSEVQTAWGQGYTGKNVTITVVDDHRTTGQKYQGRFLNSTMVFNTHGAWTSLEAQMVAPGATVVNTQFTGAAPIALAATGLNVINASYGMMGIAGLNPTSIRFAATESSMIADAAGKAVVVKAAGNDGNTDLLAKNYNGQQDYLNIALKGTASTIYAGSLESNGTTAKKATIASYSNRAGTDAYVQSHYLMVGVVRSQTQLGGTSFAAPIISGYAAVVGSKFTTATATQVTNQLLNTARTDTINGYNAAIHGRGEASLTRALAPVAIK